MDWFLNNWDVILQGLGFLDIVAGALPDKVSRYRGIILPVAKVLHDWGVNDKENSR